MRPFAYVLLALSQVLAQTPPAQFEVATVRRAPPPEGDTYQINLGTIQHGTLTLTNTTLADSLRFAYHIPSDKQIDGPPWIKDKEFHYIIAAKTSPDADRETLFPMLQALLAERFQMKTHWETRELNHYELTRSKSGIKISPADTSKPREQSLRMDSIDSTQISMETVCMVIARYELRDSLVIDRTDLKGLWGVKLHWTPSRLGNAAAAQPNDAVSGPSIFTALKEQLGLTLESKKGPVEVLVVDRAEKEPVEN
jgi:uncharacterized protein (TIGR03435 family)